MVDATSSTAGRPSFHNEFQEARPAPLAAFGHASDFDSGDSDTRETPASRRQHLFFVCCGAVLIPGGKSPAAAGCPQCAPLLAPDFSGQPPQRTVAEQATAQTIADVVQDVLWQNPAELAAFYRSLVDATSSIIHQQLEVLRSDNVLLPGWGLSALAEAAFEGTDAGRAQIQRSRSFGAEMNGHAVLIAAAGPRVARALEQFLARPSLPALTDRLRSLVARIRRGQVRLRDLTGVLVWDDRNRLVLRPVQSGGFATVLTLNPLGLMACTWPWTFGVPYRSLDVAEPYWAQQVTLSKAGLDSLNQRRILGERPWGYSPGQIADRLGYRPDYVTAVLQEFEPEPALPDPPAEPQTEKEKAKAKKKKEKEEQAKLQKLKQAAARPPRLDPKDAVRLAECGRMLTRYRTDRSVTLAEARESLFGSVPSLPFGGGVPGGPPADRDALLPPAATLQSRLSLVPSPDWRWQQALNEVYLQSPLAELPKVDRAIVRRATRLMNMIDRGTVDPASAECQAYKLWCQAPARNVVESLLLAGMPPALVDGVVNVPAGTCQPFEDFYFARVATQDALALLPRGSAGSDDPLVRSAGHLLSKLARQGAGAAPVLKALSYLSQAVPGSVPPGLKVGPLGDADFLEFHLHWTATQVGPLAMEPLLEFLEAFRTLRIKKESRPPRIAGRSVPGRVRHATVSLDELHQPTLVGEAPVLLLPEERPEIVDQPPQIRFELADGF